MSKKSLVFTQDKIRIYKKSEVILKIMVFIFIKPNKQFETECAQRINSLEVSNMQRRVTDKKEFSSMSEEVLNLFAKLIYPMSLILGVLVLFNYCISIGYFPKGISLSDSFIILLVALLFSVFYLIFLMFCIFFLRYYLPIYPTR
ncbi:hypothetical protein DB317_17085 [Vibrio cholerae]|nr:hypothetical protein DB317_17085 [Vibrio cholerae]